MRDDGGERVQVELPAQGHATFDRHVQRLRGGRPIRVGGVLDADAALIEREVSGVPGRVVNAHVLVDPALADPVVRADLGGGVQEGGVTGGQGPDDVVDDDASTAVPPRPVLKFGEVFQMTF